MARLGPSASAWQDPPCGWAERSLYSHRTLSAEQLGTRYRHSREKYIAAEKRREKDTRPKSAAKHTATSLDTHKTEHFKRIKEACVSKNQSANGKQPLQSCTLWTSIKGACSQHWMGARNRCERKKGWGGEFLCGADSREMHQGVNAYSLRLSSSDLHLQESWVKGTLGIRGESTA